MSPAGDSRRATEWAPPDAALADDASGAAPQGVSVGGGWAADAPAPMVEASQGPERRVSGWAKAALVAGLVGLAPLAVGFAVAAFMQVRRRGGRYRGMAVGGLVASAVWVVVGAVIAVMLFSPGGGDSGGDGKGRETVLSRLKAGDCFAGFRKEAMDVAVTALPCTRPHDGEVVAQAALPDDDAYPGDKGLAGEATKVCTDRLAFLVKSRYYEDLDVYLDKPDQAAWRAGDRHVTCVMRYSGTGTLASPLVATLDPARKTLQEFEAGDCFTEWKGAEAAARAVPCTEPHKVQVYAAFDLPWEGLATSGVSWAYPGKKIIDENASRGCRKRAAKAFTTHVRPAGVRTDFVGPSAKAWYFGVQKVICLLRADKGTLKRSVLGK